MGRSHDHYCFIGQFHWSPFDFDGCPDHGGYECFTYDLNHEEGQTIEDSAIQWMQLCEYCKGYPDAKECNCD